MFGNGETHYHPLYIDNLIDAFELAAQSDKGNGETYLIADEKAYTLNELVLAIAESLGVDLTIRHYPFWPLWAAALACEIAYKPLPMDPPLFRRRVDWFRQNRAFSIERAKKELSSLTGLKPLTVLSTFKDDQGWHVGVEMLEMSRIPTATDMLGDYEALFAEDGTLLKFERRRTRVRGDPMQER